MYKTNILYGPAINKPVGLPTSTNDEERLISALTMQLSNKDTGSSESAFKGAIQGFIDYVESGSPIWKRPTGIGALLERPCNTGTDLFPQVFRESSGEKTIELGPAFDGEGSSKPNLVLGSWAQSFFLKFSASVPRPQKIDAMGGLSGADEGALERNPQLVGWDAVEDYGPLAVVHLVLTKIANNASGEIQPNGNKFSGFLSRLVNENPHTSLSLKRVVITDKLYAGEMASSPRDVSYLYRALEKLPDLLHQISEKNEAIAQANERYTSLVQSKEAEKNKLIDLFVTKGNAHMILNLEQERAVYKGEIQRYAKELEDTRNKHLSIITTQGTEIARYREDIAKANLLLVDSHNQELANIEKGNNAIRQAKNIADQRIQQAEGLVNQRINEVKRDKAGIRTCAAATIGFFTVAALCFK
jgi:hypothetical protein